MYININTRTLLLTVCLLICANKAQDVPAKIKPVSDTGSKPMVKSESINNSGKDVKPPPPHVPKKHHVRLEDTVECADDVKRFCSNQMQSNNFMILDCLQDSEKVCEKPTKLLDPLISLQIVYSSVICILTIFSACWINF